MTTSDPSHAQRAESEPPRAEAEPKRSEAEAKRPETKRSESELTKEASNLGFEATAKAEPIPATSTSSPSSSPSPSSAPSSAPSLAPTDPTGDHGFLSEAISFAEVPPVAEADQLAAVVVKLAQSERQCQELTDKNTRLQAEMENLRRRSARDVSEAQKFGISKMAMEVAEVTDHLTIALSLLPASMLPENQPQRPQAQKSPLEQLINGIILTEKSIVAMLQRYGVTRALVQVGDKFDPNCHQALGHVDSDTVAPGCVVQSHGNSYWIGERLLRPAMVVVARVPDVAPPRESANDATVGGSSEVETGDKTRDTTRDSSAAAEASEVASAAAAASERWRDEAETDTGARPQQDMNRGTHVRRNL